MVTCFVIVSYAFSLVLAHSYIAYLNLHSSVHVNMGNMLGTNIIGEGY